MATARKLARKVASITTKEKTLVNRTVILVVQHTCDSEPFEARKTLTGVKEDVFLNKTLIGQRTSLRQYLNGSSISIKDDVFQYETKIDKKEYVEYNFKWNKLTKRNGELHNDSVWVKRLKNELKNCGFSIFPINK